MKKMKTQPLDLDNERTLFLLMAQGVVKFLDGVSIEEYRENSKEISTEFLGAMFATSVSKDISKEDKTEVINLYYEMGTTSLRIKNKNKETQDALIPF